MYFIVVKCDYLSLYCCIKSFVCSLCYNLTERCFFKGSNVWFWKSCCTNDWSIVWILFVRINQKIHHCSDLFCFSKKNKLNKKLFKTPKVYSNIMKKNQQQWKENKHTGEPGQSVWISVPRQDMILEIFWPADWSRHVFFSLTRFGQQFFPSCW